MNDKGEGKNLIHLWVWVSEADLCRRAEISGRAAGARVRWDSACTAAHWGGRSCTSRGFWDTGGLTQDAVLVEPSPRRAPTEEELIQQLHLESERYREGEKGKMNKRGYYVCFKGITTQDKIKRRTRMCDSNVSVMWAHVHINTCTSYTKSSLSTSYT